MPKQLEPDGKTIASLATLMGLALVWSVVWANLPSRDELLSDRPQLGAPVVPSVPELDLTIPGVPALRPAGEPGQAGGIAVHRESHPRPISEVKCEAEAQQACRASLVEEERRQCESLRLEQRSVLCRRLAQQRPTQGK